MLLATTRLPHAVCVLFSESEGVVTESSKHRPDRIFAEPQYAEEMFLNEVSSLSALSFTVGRTFQIPGRTIAQYFLERKS